MTAVQENIFMDNVLEMLREPDRPISLTADRCFYYHGMLDEIASDLCGAESRAMYRRRIGETLAMTDGGKLILNVR